MTDPVDPVVYTENVWVKIPLTQDVINRACVALNNAIAGRPDVNDEDGNSLLSPAVDEQLQKAAHVLRRNLVRIRVCVHRSGIVTVQTP